MTHKLRKTETRDERINMIKRTSALIILTLSILIEIALLHKIYKEEKTSINSSFRTVSMIPGDLKGLPDVYSSFSNIGGIC